MPVGKTKMLFTKSQLKRIIKEELNKTLISNEIASNSEVAFGFLQAVLLRMKFAIVQECLKVNEQQNYNMTEDQLNELVDMLCDRVPELAHINEEDYSRTEDDLKHRSEIDKANRKNLQKDKLQLQQKKIADKLRSF